MEIRDLHDDNQVPEYVFVLGNVHNKIGGPTRTISGYVSGLLSLGSKCSIAGVGSEWDIEEAFGDVGSCKLIPVGGGLLHKVTSIISLYRQAGSRTAFVVVGVWHLPFFVLGVTNLIYAFLRISTCKKIVLVPTMSLTQYDWAKHAWKKKALLPLVAIILRGLTGVIFASSGELEKSRPSSWRNSCVILHPTVSVERPLKMTPSARDINILFAGRLDPQKDLGLLFMTLSLIDPGVGLNVVGDGEEPFKEELKSLARDLGIENRITWHGWKTHAETLSFLQRSRAVVVTSLVENFCHVAVEAIVSECDVILVDRVMSATDFASLADIDVVKPAPRALASAISQRLSSWDDRSNTRATSSINIKDVCHPASAAAKLQLFMNSAHLSKPLERRKS